MDQKRFDRLTRFMAPTGSRRAALTGMLGAVLLGQRTEPAEARCRGKKGKHKRQCRRRQQHQHGRGGSGGCAQDKLFGLCFAFQPQPCCNDMRCTQTFTPGVTACQFICETDADCKRAFPKKALACRTDALVCPTEALVGLKCCVPQ